MGLRSVQESLTEINSRVGTNAPKPLAPLATEHPESLGLEGPAVVFVGIPVLIGLVFLVAQLNRR